MMAGGAAGDSLLVFLGVTLVFAGGCAFMTGQAVAATWRPAWQVVLYALLLAAADRFLVFALFDGSLLSPAGYVTDAVTLEAIALAAYYRTRARVMVRQYPWLYQPAGPFGWRERAKSDGSHSTDRG